MENNDFFFETRRNKWREERLSKISVLQKTENLKQLQKNHTSFLKKEMMFSSVSDFSKQELQKLANSCTKS